MSSRFSTAIQRCDSKGAKWFGRYYVVGSVPATCHRVSYGSEGECLAAILADPWIKSEPTQLIQMADCSRYEGAR